MRVYKHRRDPDYLGVLLDRLSFDTDDGLLKRAVPITTPRIHEGNQYSRCCRIDFAGISASTLFDYGGSFTGPDIASNVKRIFENAVVLNDQGIFVKFRILLVYPYSAYALSRMQAESTVNRSSMEEPIYCRNFDIVESVDHQAFLQSHFVLTQTQMLEQLQEWADKAGWDQKALNRIYVRFVPASPNFCVLVVNDTAFIDPYLLAKFRRAQRECASLGPLVQIEKEEDEEHFAAIDDHFRYLWDLDLSIHCQDGTYYKQDKSKSLSRVKPPAMISFDNKAISIKEKNPTLSDEYIAKWKSRMQRMLSRFCMEPAPTPGVETLFITCSWKSEDGQATPNNYAIDLSNCLEEDFGRRSKKALLSVFIMEGVAGDFFTQQLYARLDESTLGLVLLTADIIAKDGKYYSKPNVYHELGYLMKQLGPKRVAVVCEGGVTVPSNIHDVIRIDYEKGKLLLAYSKIAGWVLRSANLGDVVRGRVEIAINSRLDQEVRDGKITADEGKKSKERVSNHLQQAKRDSSVLDDYERGR
jgi:predicted nucleotide-binding protein with TIR-like domain